MDQNRKYSKYTIVNIRRGKDSRSHLVYAEVFDTTENRVAVSALLDYCVRWIEDMVLNEDL